MEGGLFFHVKFDDMVDFAYRSQLAVLNLTALHTIPALYSTQFKCNALECTVLYRNALHFITTLHFTSQHCKMTPTAFPIT